MTGKRTNNEKKIKLNRKLLRTICILLFVIAVIFAIIMVFKPVNVGKINKNGKAEYIERIANVTKNENNMIIEFKNKYELIDNGVITIDIAQKFKTICDNFADVSLNGIKFDPSIWTLEGFSNHTFWNQQRKLAKQLLEEISH